MQKRTITAQTDFQTREADGRRFIEGYFAVFGGQYELWSNTFETIEPGAFDLDGDKDIRCLTNHDTTLVLGRTKANTLELKTDSHGLWGRVRINPNDSEAMNTYERVKRGDVDQCSIGFMIRSQETDFREDGSIHWTITDVELYEVSVCTFPAYEETSVSARRKDAAEIRSRQLEAWKLQMKDRLTKSNQEE